MLIKFAERRLVSESDTQTQKKIFTKESGERRAFIHICILEQNLYT